MTLSSWKLNGHLAELHSDRLSAEVDLARPADGVFRLRAARTRVGDSRVLGVVLPGRAEDKTSSPPDAYVRSAELAATYNPSGDWPVRVDVAWREVSRSAGHQLVAALELVVSVRTDALRSQPRLVVQSAFSGGELAVAVDQNAERFEPLMSSTADSAPGNDGRGCLVFRPAGSDLSYVEMVHPLDFRRDELSGGGNEPFLVRHHLFDDSLEKGVVLRARLRGLFVPRDNDSQLACEEYAAFKAAEPLLGA